MQFEMLKEKSSIIKVIGVGGGGGNAVNHMYRQGITGVDFIICNTDAQALELSPIPNKVQLGASLTEGMGAGSIPEVGKNSAIENIDDIKEMLGANTKMLFITAGMGGGTGTGASPIIAKAAKELDILVVGIVTTPFSFEGKRRKMQAEDGLEEMKKYVDSFLVISNDRLREIFGNLTLGSAFGQADDILTTAAKGIAEIITKIENAPIQVGTLDITLHRDDLRLRPPRALMPTVIPALGVEGRDVILIDDVLYSPRQVEIVLTLDNTSDCFTMWRVPKMENDDTVINDDGDDASPSSHCTDKTTTTASAGAYTVHSIQTVPNSILILESGGVEHKVTPLSYGKRTILKMAFVSKDAVMDESMERHASHHHRTHSAAADQKKMMKKKRR